MQRAELAAILAAWPIGDVRRTQPTSSGIDNVNIRVWTTKGKFILTFHRDVAQLQTLQALSRHLARRHSPVPQYVPAKNGAMRLKTPYGFASLTIHLPGKHPRKPIPLPTLRNLGAVLGALDEQLGTFRTPPPFTPMDWETLDARLSLMRARDPQLHAQLHPIYLQVRRALRALLPRCRRSLIHADYTEVNVLVRGEKVTAVLDFGDMEHSYLPADAAVAITHQCCLRGRAIPRAAGAFLEGYLDKMPLTRAELRSLFWLILKRGLDLTTYFWEQRYSTTSDHLGPRRMNSEMVRWGVRSLDSWHAVGPQSFAKLYRSSGE